MIVDERSEPPPFSSPMCEWHAIVSLRQRAHGRTAFLTRNGEYWDDRAARGRRRAEPARRALPSEDDDSSWPAVDCARDRRRAVPADGDRDRAARPVPPQ